MPLDYGCWFDQHHGVEDLRPNLVKPHPEEPVCAEQPRATWSLPPQDGHLMSQGDEFKLQGGAAANTEREQGNEGGKNCDHAHDGMAVARKSLAFLNFQGFEQPQLLPYDQLLSSHSLTSLGPKKLGQFRLDGRL